MSRSVGSIILILFGCGVLAVVWRGFLARELPAGSAGWCAYRPNRSDNPLAFHFFLLLYFCGGMALAVWRGSRSHRSGLSATRTGKRGHPVGLKSDARGF